MKYRRDLIPNPRPDAPKESFPKCGEILKSKQTASGLLAPILIGLIVGLLIFKVLTG